MQHRRRRDRHLRRALRHRVQELEVAALDRLRVADLARDVHHRRREVDVAGVAVEADGDAALGLHAVQLLEEVDVEVGAAELAVGDAVRGPDLPGSGRCRESPRPRPRAARPAPDRAGLERLARVEQRLRAQETADVVGAKRRRGANSHDVLLGGLSRAPTRCGPAARFIIRAYPATPRRLPAREWPGHRSQDERRHRR